MEPAGKKARVEEALSLAEQEPAVAETVPEVTECVAAAPSDEKNEVDVSEATACEKKPKASPKGKAKAKAKAKGKAKAKAKSKGKAAAKAQTKGPADDSWAEEGNDEADEAETPAPAAKAAPKAKGKAKAKAKATAKASLKAKTTPKSKTKAKATVSGQATESSGTPAPDTGNGAEEPAQEKKRTQREALREKADSLVAELGESPQESGGAGAGQKKQPETRDRNKAWWFEKNLHTLPAELRDLFNDKRVSRAA